jgi:hypothetical protein
MAKSVCKLLLMMLLTALVAFPSLTQEKREITQKSLEWNVQNLDWIIQGQITDAQPKYMTTKELFGVGSDKNEMVVTEITMRVEKVIAGEYEANDLVFIIEEGKLDGLISGIADEPLMQVNVGDSAIVGLWANLRGTSHNIHKILDNRDAFFKIKGGKLIPYPPNRYLSLSNPLKVIKDKARKREMKSVFDYADLVCLGTVTYVTGWDMRSPKLVIKIAETLKGSSDKSEITVDVTNTSRSFENKRPGYQVLLFLKRTGQEYIPVEGVNGYYVVEGEKITRGHTLPPHTNMSQIKSKISVWKEEQK